VEDSKGVLEATTLLAELNRQHPGQFSEGQLRTLQRRVRQWRALSGPNKEVFFPQEHPPGREAAYDFTNCDELGVTISGAPFEHLLFELVLSFSGWRWATVASRESYEALLLGVQEALWRLGGVVEVLRSDNLSAATHELPVSGGRALTRRYQSLLDHYGLTSTRIFPRNAHENGVVEQAHRRTKSVLAQTLVLRGSHDFPSVDEYQRWVREVIEREHNALLGEKLVEEHRHLRPLPEVALPAYTRFTVRVRRWSTIRLVNHTYSVPARLIGERVRVHLHHDQLEVYYAGKLVERLPRLRGQRWARIDYHHVIWSLVKKPGAPLPATAGARSCFRVSSSDAPTMHCAASTASGPMRSTCESFTWRRLAASSWWSGPWASCWRAASDLTRTGFVIQSDPSGRACRRLRSARRT